MSDLGAHDNAADHAEILLIGAAVLIAQSNPILFIGHIEIIILVSKLSRVIVGRDEKGILALITLENLIRAQYSLNLPSSCFWESKIYSLDLNRYCLFPEVFLQQVLEAHVAFAAKVV